MSVLSGKKVVTDSNDDYFGRDHVTVIAPHGRSFDLKLRELWAYRDLIQLLVRRDFVAQYKQTVLGPIWHFMQPFLTTVIFTIVFGKIARIPTDDAPPFLFYMAGTILWVYFSGVLTTISTTFFTNATLFGKIYFPRLVIPVATLLSHLIAFSFQFLFFLGFVAYDIWSGHNVNPNSWMIITPVLMFLLAMLSLGLGVIVSAVTVRYRDLAILIGFGVQLFMFLTPVVYPVSILSPQYQNWMLLNPVAPIIETFRFAFLGTGSVPIAGLVLSVFTISLILVIGICMFNRVERTFLDTI